MSIGNRIEIRVLMAADCGPGMLRDFERRQVVTHCWRRRDGEWVLEPIVYTEDWDEAKKEAVTRSLASCTQDGGIVLGAYDLDRLVGFAAIEPGLFGGENRYVNLDMIHVSNGVRGLGIGRKLFEVCCEKAHCLGARKLYISAHSSAESMAFYRRMGCVDAQQINEAMAEKEPCDCQLEKVIG